MAKGVIDTVDDGAVAVDDLSHHLVAMADGLGLSGDPLSLDLQRSGEPSVPPDGG